MIQYFHLPRVAAVCCFLLAFPSYGEKGTENPAFSASLYKWSTRPAESGDFPLKRELQIGLKIKEESDWKIAYFRDRCDCGGFKGFLLLRHEERLFRFFLFRMPHQE